MITFPLLRTALPRDARLIATSMKDGELYSGTEGGSQEDSPMLYHRHHSGAIRAISAHAILRELRATFEPARSESPNP